MKFYNKFLTIHELLKQHSCKATYDFEKEYQEPPVLGGGYNFYKPETEMHNDIHKNEWDERTDAVLDVTIQTKWREAPKGEIRFDIDYSNRVKLYSMYISLPTESRSKSLSKKTYKSQDEVIAEIKKWLKAAGCKVKSDTKAKGTKVIGQQMNLFDFAN